jgi:hypothetical protein
MPELILKEEVYQIVGAALEVYWHLGAVFWNQFIKKLWRWS